MRPTPQDLLEAVERNDLDAVLRLLELGVDPDVQDEYGMTALSYAVRNRRIDIVEALLRRGAALDGGDLCHGNAMMWAAAEARAGELYHQAWRGRESDRRFFEMLKEAGGRCDLREAVLMGDVELARRICDQDPTVDVSGDALFPVHDTFLMIAADLGERAMVDFLLERGADPNGTDDLGITALMRAAAAGHAPVVERLITGGPGLIKAGPIKRRSPWPKPKATRRRRRFCCPEERSGGLSTRSKKTTPTLPPGCSTRAWIPMRHIAICPP